jgi:ABC-type multidrug transport system fused ATPase/permease subunit
MATGSFGIDPDPVPSLAPTGLGGPGMTAVAGSKIRKNRSLYPPESHLENDPVQARIVARKFIRHVDPHALPADPRPGDPGILQPAFSSSRPVLISGRWWLSFASEIGTLLGIYGLISTNVPFFMHTMTLLRKNLLKHILRRPGASALPDSPGEAISRFRGDVFEIPLFSLWINDMLGSISFSVVALIIMFRISPSITTVAILPFIVVDSSPAHP